LSHNYTALTGNSLTPQNYNVIAARGVKVLLGHAGSGLLGKLAIATTASSLYLAADANGYDVELLLNAAKVFKYFW
jgi:hypothetical protein